jgi:sugar/nucleoside kinase (ribokinase family)
MANALARLGVKVTYVGALGYPQLHPVFTEFARNAEVHGIADPGHTDALEFEDGKLMLTKTTSLDEVTWENIQRRFGRGKFIDQFSTADLVGFVNWTMIPFMSELWASLLQEFCPIDHSLRRKIFFDLADPEKRTPQDIARALELIAAFEKYFEVILGLNEKEAFAVGDVLGVNTSNRNRDGLATVASEIQKRAGVGTLVVHPVTYAVATSGDSVASVDGPFVEKPLITTGAGDHFNSGFCLGKLLGFDNPTSVLCGVSASGHYVRSGQSPTVEDLAAMMRAWPSR